MYQMDQDRQLTEAQVEMLEFKLRIIAKNSVVINNSPHVVYYAALYTEDGNEFCDLDEETGELKRVVFQSIPIPRSKPSLVMLPGKFDV